MTPSLTITMTAAGHERFTAAQVGQGIQLQISSVGLTDAVFVPAPTLDALPGELRRLQTISGEAVGNNIVHMVIRDTDQVGYTVRGIGLFLSDGTLFAVYGQDDPIFEKSTQTTLHLALDIAFTTPEIEALTFGDTNFLIPPATTTTRGVVELATQDEADAGVDTQRVAPVSVTRRMIATAIEALGAMFGEALDGLAARTAYGAGLVTGGGRNDANRTFTVESATGDEIRVGAVGTKAVTPKSLSDARMLYVVDSGDNFKLLSDGSMEQWGIASLPVTESAFTLVFPRPFPTRCDGLFAMTINSAQSPTGDTTVQEIALAAASARLFAQSDRDSSSDAAGGFRWRAWGR